MNGEVKFVRGNVLTIVESGSDADVDLTLDTTEIVIDSAIGSIADIQVGDKAEVTLTAEKNVKKVEIKRKPKVEPVKVEQPKKV